MSQKELKEKYMEYISEVFTDKKMQDYIKGKIQVVVELNNGELYGIEKPSINKDFCFGYGFCGVSTEEDYQQAQKAADNAKTNEKYFIEKNLEELEIYMNSISGDRYKVVKRPQYYKQGEDNKLRNLDFVDHYTDLQEGQVELTEDEKKAILQGYNEVKQAFIKRLHTYLKRYGMKHVNTWSYLCD